MQELVISPLGSSAASALRGEGILSCLPEVVNNHSKRSNRISSAKLKKGAEELYEKLMQENTRSLFNCFESTCPKRPIRVYSYAVKTMTVCSLYLLAAEDSNKKRPEWLIKLLREAMYYGDRLEPEPTSSDLLAHFASHSRAKLIDSVSKLSLAYLDIQNTNANDALRNALANGQKERFDILDRVMRNEVL